MANVVWMAFGSVLVFDVVTCSVVSFCTEFGFIFRGVGNVCQVYR